MSSQNSAVTFNDVIFNEVTFNDVIFNEVTFNDVIFEQLTQEQLHHQKYAGELYDETLEMLEMCEKEMLEMSYICEQVMSDIKKGIKVDPQHTEFLNHRLQLTHSKLQFYRSVLSLDLQTALMMKDKHFEVSTEYLMFLSENNQCENEYLDECISEKHFHEGFLFLIEKVEFMTDPDLDDEFKYMPVVFRKRERERVSAPIKLEFFLC